MARSNVVTPEQATNTTSEPRTTASIGVQVPIALKELLDAKAAESDMNASSYVRKLLADTLEYTLPLPAPRGRRSQFDGMTAEQIKAKKAEDQKARQRNIKALLAAARNGEVDLEALLAKYAPTATSENGTTSATETTAASA